MRAATPELARRQCGKRVRAVAVIVVLRLIKDDLVGQHRAAPGFCGAVENPPADRSCRTGGKVVEIVGCCYLHAVSWLPASSPASWLPVTSPATESRDHFGRQHTSPLRDSRRTPRRPLLRSQPDFYCQASARAEAGCLPGLCSFSRNQPSSRRCRRCRRRVTGATHRRLHLRTSRRTRRIRRSRCWRSRASD